MRRHMHAHMHAYIHTYIHTYIIHASVALHYITVQYSIGQHSTVQYSTFHYITIHYTTLHYTTLHYISFHYTTFHYITLHYATLHYITSNYITVHCTQTRGLTDYGVKCGNPVVLFLEPKMLRYTHCETCNCRRMRRNCVSPHALKDYSLTYHTDGHGVRTILTPPAPLAAVCTIG